jgi:hypothetical protein
MTAPRHRSLAAIAALTLGTALDPCVYAQGIALEVDAKKPLVLGEVDEVPITIQAPETKETEDRPLRVAVNVGTFSAVERTSPGVYRATYKLPETRFPQVALVAVWRETGPDAPIDFLRIPLFGRTKLPVRSTKGAEIRVVAGEVTYGPVLADARGRAEIVVAVPPGVTEVVATSSKGRELSQGTVAVDVPPYNRLTLAVTPYLVPADGGSSVTVHAFYDVERDPPPMERIKVGVEKGELRGIGQDGNRYRFRFVPARGTEAHEVNVRASVATDKASHAEATISLGLPTPEKIVSRGTIVPLVADGATETELDVLVLDRLGLGVPKLAVSASAAIDRVITSAARELGKGEYAIALRGPSRFPKDGKLGIDVDAVAPSRSQGSIARARTRLELLVAPPPWPVSTEIEADPAVPIADGETPFRITIRTFDAAGRVFGSRIPIHLRAGDAEVSTVEPVEDGTYRADVTPKRGVGALDLSITDDGGHLESIAHVPLRAPPSMFSVGAFVAGVYNATLVPSVGIEGAFRPLALDRRLAIDLRVSYREIGRQVTIAGLPSIDTKLQLLPISIGAKVDFYRSADLRAYAGGAFEIVPFAENESSTFAKNSVYRRIAPGAELSVGAAYDEIFLELEASWANLVAPDLVRPRPAILLLIGYRFGL